MSPQGADDSSEVGDSDAEEVGVGDVGDWDHVIHEVLKLDLVIPSLWCIINYLLISI